MHEDNFDFKKAYKGGSGKTFADAVLADMPIKRQIAKAANTLTELSAMSLPRHERRRLAKVNGINKIVGSTKPLIK